MKNKWKLDLHATSDLHLCFRFLSTIGRIIVRIVLKYSISNVIVLTIDVD